MKVVLSEKEKEVFLDRMAELKRTGCRNPFVKMSEFLVTSRKEGPYNARQLCHYWRNYLDPGVCQVSLNDEEKQFIEDWIVLNKSGNGGIEWKKLRQDLKNQFGSFRSENKIKNYWYSKQRSRKGTNNGTIMSNTIKISTLTTPIAHSYPFGLHQPQNQPSLPHISYIFNNNNDPTLQLPRLLHYQQNLSTLPTFYPRLIQEPKLPILPPNI
ncbi:unnamed protein product [Rhizophagus irregularis]|uniref:HTH myb-type domain-containing protein n=1 Tax=Rhizophagus irregularis TaxID=588596 RepID=A0A2N1N5E4_9GLOM|nr:hypothetical protein RhiirC2_850950 [Rhizophagus irregularis]CAB4383626.1 unnamed protein product [Rhizophagus irregularis]CAB5353115.1 unnamed protein product [Rhizophagus irregularis]